MVVLRLAALVLIGELAWFALDPSIDPNSSDALRVVHLASYFVLGALCTAAFPRRVWIGIGAALLTAVGIELLQILVPVRDMRTAEVALKWLTALAGIAFALAVMFVFQRSLLPRR